MQGELLLLHHIPGRMRIKLTCTKGIEEITGKIKERPGITGLSFSPVTKNILIRFNSDTLSGQQVISQAGILSNIFDDSTADDKAAAVLLKYTAGKHRGKGDLRTTVINRVRKVNSEVCRWTGGQADLKLLFPVGIFFWAIFLFISGGQWMQPSYYSLMLAAFSVFMVLNLS